MDDSWIYTLNSDIMREDKERLKRQEECLVRRQHRREEIIANKEARRLRKEAREREREEKNQ